MARAVLKIRRDLNMNTRVTDFHNKLIDKANEFLSDSQTEGDLEASLIFLMLHYLVKSYKLLKGINSLCKERLDSNAKILLRSLFEAFCLSAYLANKPDDTTRVEDCNIRWVFAKKKQREELKDLRFLDIEAIDEENIKKQIVKRADDTERIDKRIISDYEEAIRRLRERQEYKCQTDKEIEKKFQNEIDNKILSVANRQYQSPRGAGKNLITKYRAVVIRDSSLSVHCNDFRDHVCENKSGGWKMLLDDSQRHTNSILMTSANMFIEIMNLANEVLTFGKDSLIQELREEWANIR